ncbi:MAG: MFS transporter [Erysipelotrichaceae bacterium]|nr:MFS transporter [Erysipelotrichaceae bacterium]MBQ4252328.1 MFS transporter [Erysipelotrichaceae bacterium]
MKKKKENWPLRMAAVEFTYWFAMGTVNYLTVFLEGNGYTVTQVGMINTINSLAATLFSPIGGAIADRIRSSRKAFVIFSIAMSICYALVPVTLKIYVLGVSLLTFFSALYNAFSMPSQALVETTVVKGCLNTRTDFGVIRTGGTLGYVVVSILLSKFVNDQNCFITFFLLGLLMLPCLYSVSLISSVCDDSVTSRRLSFRDLPFGKLFRNPLFVAYLIFNILQYVPQMAVQYYQPYLIKEAGASMTYIGYLQAYRAIFELPALIWSQRIARKISNRNMVVISSVLFAVQSLLYRFVNSFGQILAATTFSGLATGFLIAGGIKYVNEITDESVQATAQTLVSSIRSFSGIIGGYLGAMLIEWLGIRNFFLSTGGIMFMAAVFLYLSTVLAERKRTAEAA